MKRIVTVLCLLLVMTGCAGSGDEMNRAMTLRTKLQGQGISFDGDIAADYGDKIFEFSLSCQVDTQGNMTFTVRQPEAIAGITGTVGASGGKLTFDDKALAFEQMADGQITPVAAPWVLMHTLRSGYLTSCGKEGETLRITIDDSYADDALHLDVWLDEQDLPKYAEILWQGRRILSVKVKNFRFL